MSKTPNRDAAVEANRLARAQYQDVIDAGGREGIAQRMACEMTEATTIGMGELLDLGTGLGAVGTEIMRAHSAGIASFLLSAARADVALADSLIEGALRDLARQIRWRLTRSIDATVAPEMTKQ